MKDLIKYLNVRIQALENECINKDFKIELLSKELNKIKEKVTN